MIKNLLILLIILFCSLELIASEGNEDFDEFLRKFEAYGEFQLQRVKFPINKTILTDDLLDAYDICLEVTDWEDIKIRRDAICTYSYPQVYDNFDMKYADTGQRVLAIRGVDDGVAMFYYFELIEGKWYLVKFEDLST